MEYLRKAQLGGWQKTWTKQQILAGLQHFKQLNGHYPSAHEIDKFKYLPSARSIQRAYGGLVNLRKELLPNEHANLTTGVYRSAKAKQTYSSGKDYESQFYSELIKYFKEISVHEHKVIRPAFVNSDFHIYLSENNGVVIDIFYAESIINLVNVVNIKLKRYSLITQETYLVVVGNPLIEHNALVQKMENKKLPLPEHINVVTENYFFEKIIPKLILRSQYAN